MQKGLLFAKRTITLAKRADVCIVVSCQTLQPSLPLWIYIVCIHSKNWIASAQPDQRICLAQEAMSPYLPL